MRVFLFWISIPDLCVVKHRDFVRNRSRLHLQYCWYPATIFHPFLIEFNLSTTIKQSSITLAVLHNFFMANRARIHLSNFSKICSMNSSSFIFVSGNEKYIYRFPFNSFQKPNFGIGYNYSCIYVLNINESSQILSTCPPSIRVSPFICHDPPPPTQNHSLCLFLVRPLFIRSKHTQTRQ